MLNVSVLCFLASYLLAFGLEWTRFVSRHAAGRWITLGIGVAGFIAQTLYLLLRAQQTLLPPLLSSMQDWLLVLAWLMVLLHLFVALADRDLALGFVAWPLTIALIVASQFSSTAAGTAASVHENWTMLHVALLVFGVAGVAVGFIASLLYLWQHRRMKQGISPGAGLGLPSLERLAKVNRWAVLVSVPLLTFGMVTGIGLIFARSTDTTAADLWFDPIVVASGVCWLLMTGMFVWVVSGNRQAGRQMAMLTAWACGFLLLTTVGAQVLAKSLSKSKVHSTEAQFSKVGYQEPGQ